MTREEMATAAEWGELSIKQAEVIAAELRKTCAGCKHFERGEAKRPEWTEPMTWVSCRERRVAVYQFEDDTILPKDGTGFCHRWEVK